MSIKSIDHKGPFNIFAETQTSIEFYHLDPLWVVWHGNYLNFFENGRRALFEKIGYSYLEMEKTGFAFPVVDISVRYTCPLRIQDQIKIKAILMEYENCLKIKYEIRNIETDQITTKGISTQMAYNINKGEACFVCPKILIERVEALIEKQSQ